MANNITKAEVLALCKAVNSEVGCINWGGCGVFAYLAGKALSKFDNCSVSIRVVCWDYEHEKALPELVPPTPGDVYSWRRNNVNFNHIVLEVKLKHVKPFLIDSDGLFLEYEDLITGSVPVETIKGVVSTLRGWNDTFNRRQIPEISRIIRHCVRGIKGLSKELSVKDWELV